MYFLLDRALNPFDICSDHVWLVLNWDHVSHLQYWNEPIAKSYQVRSIPATFILDENGRIIAKNLRGSALEQKLEELLSN